MAGPLVELEFGGGAKAGEDWMVGVDAAGGAAAPVPDWDTELGEDTLDFASLHVPFSALLLVVVSGLDGNCLVIPKSTSATSNSISWTDEGGLEFLGGRSLFPLPPPLSGFIFFLTEAVEEDGEMGVVEAGGGGGAGGLGLAGEVEAWR